MNQTLTKITKTDKTELLRQCYTDCGLQKGVEMTAAQISFFAKETNWYINKRCWWLSDIDIRTAFKKGLYGDYGDYFGINTVNSIKWINRFLSEKKEKNMEQKQEKKTLTEEEKYNICRNGAANAYLEFLRGNLPTNRGNWLYNYLVGEKILEPLSDTTTVGNLGTGLNIGCVFVRETQHIINFFSKLQKFGITNLF